MFEKIFLVTLAMFIIVALWAGFLKAVENDQEIEKLGNIEQQRRVLTVDKMMRGESVTLSQLSATGVIRINCPALDNAICIWLENKGIDPLATPEVSPAYQQIDALLNSPIKLPAFQLPAE